MPKSLWLLFLIYLITLAFIIYMQVKTQVTKYTLIPTHTHSYAGKNQAN